jgi:serine/threonine protein kinase
MPVGSGNRGRQRRDCRGELGSGHGEPISRGTRLGVRPRDAARAGAAAPDRRQVYEVIHVNTGERLALKVMLARSLLAPELVERFRREARVHSFVKSDHVVRVVDADVSPELDEAPFLVMELLTGQDFERICLQRRPSTFEVVDWMRQLSPALDKAHKEGIVHRDLKPENLFLAEREGLPPIVKILDFGIAKMAAEGVGAATATGQILGTPRYMAPEQTVSAKEISAAADRFALGLITFRLLSGRHYFVGEHWMGLLREVARGPASRPSTMGCDRGHAFDAWFAKACAFEARNRFASCVEQVEALARALDSASKTYGRRRATRAWVAFAALSGLTMLGWGLQRGRTRAQPTAPSKAAPPAPSTPTLAVEPVGIRAGPPATPLTKPSGERRPRKRAVARPSERVEANNPINIDRTPDRIWDEP